MLASRSSSRSSVAAKAIATLVGAILLLVAGPARADYDFQFALGTNVRWLRETPTLTLPATVTSAREVTGGDVPMRGGITMLGAYSETSLTIDDRWSVPIVGVALYGAVGSYDAVISGADGSIVRLRPWTSSSLEVLLPGFGFRMKKRRWMFGARVRSGAGFLKMPGVVAAGADQVDVALTATTFFAQAELEGCRRLDPTTRVCVQVAPRFYDYGAFNGGTVGLRVEWGR